MSTKNDIFIKKLREMVREELKSFDEKAPSGWEGTVKALKKHGDEVDNPWALAHWMKEKGYKSHKESVNEGQWPTKGKLGGVSQEAKSLENAFKAAGVKVFKVKEYGPRGSNYFVDVQAKGGKTTISIEVNQVSNVVFMHSQGRDLKLGELKENPRKLIKVLKVLKNQPGFGQSSLKKKESVNEAFVNNLKQAMSYIHTDTKDGAEFMKLMKQKSYNKKQAIRAFTLGMRGDAVHGAGPGGMSQFARHVTKHLKESVNEAGLGDKFQKNIKRYQDRIKKEKEAYKKAREAQKKKNESVNEINGVDLAKKVLKNKSYEKGIDLQTANLIVTIDKAYDKNPALQKKFRAIPLPKMKQLIMKYYG